MTVSGIPVSTVRRGAAAHASAFLALAVVLGCATARAQDTPLEYRVKAVYLFNFVKSTQWPSTAPDGPLTICVAGSNPFGEALADAIKGEQVNGRALEARLLRKPEKGCHVLFVPEDTAGRPYLDAVQNSPTLTVGETPDFLDQGGIVRFFLDGGSVRFQIDQEAARRADVRISSQVLNLSRTGRRG